MEYLLLLLPFLFIRGSQAKQVEREMKKVEESLKTWPDRGDKWSSTYKSLNDLDHRAKPFFILLWNFIQAVGLKNNIKFAIFETRRNVNRQKRLMDQGVSWVSNPATAPHVEGRAFDIVVLEDGIYKWDDKRLKLLRDEVEKNFKYNRFLRSRIKGDLPHYELLRTYMREIK